LSTYGTHPKDFDPEQIKPVLNNLDIIIKWYLKNKKIVTIDEAKVDEEEIRLMKEPLEEVSIKERSEMQEKPAKSGVRKLITIVTIVAIVIIVAILTYPKIFKRNSLVKLRSSGERIIVAVMPFQNMTNDTTLNYLQEVIQDNLINYLSNNSEELIVRQVESTNSLIQSQGLNNYASITPSFANSISQKLKAGVYVHGTIKQMGSTIRINAQLIDSKTRDIFKSFQTEGIYKNEKILPIIDSLTALINNFLIISILEKENYEFQGYTSTNSIEAYRYYILGRNAYYKYDFDNAINWLNQSLAIDSNLTWAMFFLSAANQNGGSDNDAKKWGLKLYEKKDKLSMQEKLWASYQNTQFLKPDEAIKYLVQLKEVDTQNPYVYFTLGWNYYILNQYDDAIIEYENALEIYNKWKSKPMGVNYYYNLGSAYHKAGQFKKEKKLYKVAEKDFPNSPQLVYNQAILELSLGDTTNANHFIEVYKTFYGKNSTSEAEIYARLAEIYSKAGILDKAEEYYRKAVSLHQGYTLVLALFLIDKERNINEGLEYVNKLLDQYPNNYYFLHWKGWALYKQGRFIEALELIQRSDSLKPIFSSTFYYHLEAAKMAVAEQKNI